jgi:hypothetical protein
VLVSAANRNDHLLIDRLVDAVTPVRQQVGRPRRRPAGCTPTRDTTTGPAVRRYADVGSPPGSPVKASSRRPNSGGTASWADNRCPKTARTGARLARLIDFARNVRTIHVLIDRDTILTGAPTNVKPSANATAPTSAAPTFGGVAAYPRRPSLPTNSARRGKRARTACSSFKSVRSPVGSLPS